MEQENHMKNSKQMVELIDQMIERAQEEDKIACNKLMKENKASQTVGESWWVFHLKVLKGLANDEDEWYNI